MIARPIYKNSAEKRANKKHRQLHSLNLGIMYAFTMAKHSPENRMPQVTSILPSSNGKQQETPTKPPTYTGNTKAHRMVNLSLRTDIKQNNSRNCRTSSGVNKSGRLKSWSHNTPTPLAVRIGSVERTLKNSN